MARYYRVTVVNNPEALPTVYRVYNEPGMSWRDAKKALRQWYLDKAHSLRSMREHDVRTLNGARPDDVNGI